MADNTYRYGYRPVRFVDGNRDVKPIRRFVASGYQASPSATSVDLWPGDPVIAVSDGTVAIAAAGNSIDGVMVGVERYYDSNVGANHIATHLPGGTTWGTVEDRKSIILVVPAANVTFEVCVDDNTTATSESAYRNFIFKNADLAYTPNATTKKAVPSLHITGHNTTNTLGFRIVDVSPRIDVDFTGLNVPLYVTPNLVRQAPYQTTGV